MMMMILILYLSNFIYNWNKLIQKSVLFSISLIIVKQNLINLNYQIKYYKFETS